MNHIHMNCARNLLLSLLLWLLLPAASRADSAFFPIATNGASMGAASDETNYLAGIETPGTNYVFLTASNGIGAQLISSTGAKIGSLIVVPRSGISTCVAFDGTNYLLIWEDDHLGADYSTGGFQIYGQFISKAGATVGSPFAISDNNIWFDGIKVMAFGGGKYLVTYTELFNVAMGDNSTNRFIAGKLVSPDGTMGSEFRISTGFGDASDVAYDGTNFFVVWREDSLDQEIRGRFVSPAGVLGTEISVNASPVPSDNPKALTFGGTNYLVVWDDEVDTNTMNWDVFGQLVSPAGALVGSVITICDDPGPQIPTTVAFDGSHYLVTWMDMQNSTNWDCYGRFLTRNGSWFGDKLALSTDPGNQMAGAGFANGKYILFVNNGFMMGENGVSQVDSCTGMFMDPPMDPQVLTGDGNFGVRTNRFGFTITGYSNVVVTVDSCTNLASPIWLPVATNTLINGSSYFSDSEWANFPGRFYRLRTP